MAIIVAVALVIAIGSRGFDFYVDRRADDAQSDLRGRLEAAAPTLDHEMVLADWYEFLVTPDGPVNIGDLPEDGLIAVRADGDTVIAVYKAGFAGQDRCFDLKVGAESTDVEERDC
jgi:hypothetical protein